MKNNNYQQKVWENDFGKKYTLRSTSYSNWVKVYKERFNLTKEQINSNFLKKIPKSSKILEVGCNIGNQLKCLYKMGYKNLYGVDVQKRCIIEIINGIYLNNNRSKNDYAIELISLILLPILIQPVIIVITVLEIISKIETCN